MDEREKLVIDLAESIQSHRKLENENYCTNLAVGLANVNYFGQERKLWITNKENISGIRLGRDFTGGTNVQGGSRDTLTSDGTPVYKNTKVGECLIRNSSGDHTILTPSGNHTLSIHNTSFYTPHKHSAEALDIRMNIGEFRPRFFRSLMEILGEIKSTSEEIEELEGQITNDGEIDHTEIVTRIEHLQRQKNEAMSKAKSFIRRGYELRYQPVLDPWQEEIKRSAIFDGTIAIDGGPGTGKTTSLIQRIKFLTDKDAMAEYLPSITKEQSEKLYSPENGWVFYTPSELLKLFLKNSMVSEGLKANDQHVKIWNSEKETLTRAYKLSNPDTQGPFLFYRQKNTENLLPADAKNLKRIIDAFDRYFLQIQNDRLDKVAEIDCSAFIWSTEGQSIKNYINRQEKDYSFDGLIRLYFNLQESFADDLTRITQLYIELMRRALGIVMAEIDRNRPEGRAIHELMERWIRDNRGEDDDEDFEDVADEEEETENAVDTEVYLMTKLRALIRKTALGLYDRTVKFTARDNELKEILARIKDLNTVENLNKIGQYAYFMKYFGRLTKGPVNNLFTDIPKIYKNFRRNELTNRTNKWNFTILEQLVLRDEQKNKRLHPNEQAFLLSFINTLIRRCYKASKLKTRKFTHNYFQGYNNNSHCVIGIDEATDFHLIDLLAIHSLADYELSSVTYSGDIMQRLTKEGIKDWSELKPFVRQLDIKELQISYRQSPTLLEIASSIFNKATGREAEYISYMEKDELEPKPLFHFTSDDEAKIDWISRRILEIYKAYGDTIPSIAVFLSSEDKIDAFAEELGNTDRLADVGITVKACNKGQVLGDNNMVRVFSVDYIKGLEFEAVFYHNIDEVLEMTDREIMLKNLYVGLSRASFYMAVTSGKSMDHFPYLQEYFEHGMESWS